MTRSMADAIGAQYGSLPPGLDLYAGYVTGTPDIRWKPAQLATAAVTIDQGYQSPPVTTATVRDVEPFAWTPAAAVDRSNWQTPRPTIYCSRYDLSRAGGVLDSGWQGDLWLAIPGWQLGGVVPAAPGCNIVAVQNDFTNPAYDLSIVLDPTWPGPNGDTDMRILAVDAATVPPGALWPGDWLLRGDGTVTHIPGPAQLNALRNAGIQYVPTTYADWQALAGTP